MRHQFTIQLADNVQGVGRVGERVSLALLPADVHEVTELPEYLAGYRPFGYRADEASPLILVDNDEDKYRTFSSDDAFRRVNVKGSTQGAVPEVDPSSSLVPYKVIERYIGSFVPRQTQQQRGNNYNPIMAASRRCKRAIELDREVDVFTLLGTSGNWAAGQITAATAGGFDDTATGDPILDIQTMVEKSAQPISAIWMNPTVAHAMLRHPSVRNHMRQFLGDAGVAQVASGLANMSTQSVDFFIPGLPPFKVVGSKVKNEGTGALQYVLGNVVVGVVVPQGVPSDGEEIASTYTFRRRGGSGTGMEVREFTLENRGPQGGTMIVVTAADVPVMTGNNAGGIITGAI
jgi:hypothetical protein